MLAVAANHRQGNNVETPAFARAGMGQSCQKRIHTEKAARRAVLVSISKTPMVFPLLDAVAAYIAQNSALSYAGNHRSYLVDLRTPF